MAAPAAYHASMRPVLLLFLSALAAAAAPPDPTKPGRDLETLSAMIKPQPGESPWREIRWLTDVTEARRLAVAEDKPLVIFTAADGSPLGRT